MMVQCTCAQCKKLYAPDLMETVTIGEGKWQICSLCAYQLVERLKADGEEIEAQTRYILETAKRAIEHPEEFPVDDFPTYKPPSNLKYFGHDYD